MTVYLRRSRSEVRINGGNPQPFVLSTDISFDLQSQRWSTATIVVPRIPVGVSYYNDIEITTVVNNNSVRRFKGQVKDFTYSMNPRGVAIYCEGYLALAGEYENTEDLSAIGGLIVSDLTRGGQTIAIPGMPNGYVDTVDNIIIAVLNKAGLSGRFNGNNIDSTSTSFGLLDDAYIWRNGTNAENFDLQEEGETAMSYIERFDEVEADDDGRFRTHETLPDLGGICRKKIAYPPSGQPDITPFTETVDILNGQINRTIRKTRNYFVVTGYDFGAGAGPEFHILPTANNFQDTNSKHTKHGGSPMVERSDKNSQPTGIGQDAETLCNALSAEFNREITEGWIETFRDDLTGLLNKHLVSGNGGQPDRLGLGYLVIVVGIRITVDDQGFTQRFQYIG